MATVVLAAAGAAIGGGLGGGIAGVSSVAIGRLVGATAGRLIDQAILGNGSNVVETGRIDRFRLTGSAEGAAVSRVYGRMRVAGQVIWASQFMETVSVSGGGKGAPTQPKTRSYSYSVSLAIALCEGEIRDVGRVWADGIELSRSDLNMRVYTGSADQLPDPKMEAIEGAGNVPAHRGTAYVVFEDLALEPFGNRVPRFNFEIVRGTPEGVVDAGSDMGRSVQAVALMPGTGEYALATTPVRLQVGPGHFQATNEHTPSGKTDFVTSVDAIEAELPNCGSASLVVSWFGNDLRAAQCELRPKVEQTELDGDTMPWVVSGVARGAAEAVARLDDRPVYGGTPCDASVIEAITELRARDKRVTFYPFILMEQMAGNGLADPWSDAEDQPVLPWRGRITLSRALGQEGSPSGTVLADQEVAAFFGTASAADFSVQNGEVTYTGPQDWGYRRFVLHYAALCAAAGGVDAFCIGSEMRGLTQIKGENGFPAVQALIDLAREVRQLLGAETRLGYAADWSEYFGFHPQDGSGDVYFHLDPLWADANIDFVGIDNYMPLSDWRDDPDHLDGKIAASIYDRDYLAANVEGGEGFDWYYHSPEARAAQIRTPITDGAHQEPWVFRYKDVRGWWSNSHHERVAGVRSETPTAWVPGSKPIWFTEIGCGAIDKGTNQPNKFRDPKSSESAVPHFSSGARDDFIQQRYLQTLQDYWGDADNNPVAADYDGRMIDVSQMYVWAWDARPFPAFPNSQDVWSDGENYVTGHWINGRSSNRSLQSVVAEICARSGVAHFDVSGLEGVVRGYVQEDVSDGRAALQPLMVAYGFDALERDGTLEFRMRKGQKTVELALETCAVSSETDNILEKSREPNAEIAGRIRLNFVEAGADFEMVAEEAIHPTQSTHSVAQSEMPLALLRGEGRHVAQRWLAEAREARNGVRFALPPSRLWVGAGDVVLLQEEAVEPRTIRVERVEQGEMQLLEGVAVEPSAYDASLTIDQLPTYKSFAAPVPVQPLFLDLPLLTGDEIAHAPHLAVTGRPWPGSVAVYDAPQDEDYTLNKLMGGRATVGVTQTPLFRARPGLVDRGDGLQVKLVAGNLQSISWERLLAGGNLAAIGDGAADRWELFQFQQADLVDESTYLLKTRLRGQLGSDTVIPDAWPAGSWVVILDSNVEQIDLPASARNVARHYRIGPARRGLEDSSYRHLISAFPGVGLKPYAPVHLGAETLGNGDIRFDWVRRTRIEGDGWDLAEVPLGEESETYQIRVLEQGKVLREVTVTSPEWIYQASDQEDDAVELPFSVEIAQVSARFGPGDYRAIEIV